MTARTVRTRHPRLSSLLGWTLLALAAGAGGLVALHGFGVVDVPFLRREAAAEVGGPSAPVVPPGMVVVPISVRRIEAYRRVTGEDLWDSSAQRWATFPVSVERVEAEGICRHVDDVVRRVLQRDKEPNLVFHESDFFPRGTRPGVTAGIPPGKRALRLDARDFPGLRDLEAGDRFDIVATIALDRSARGLTPGSVGGPLASRLEVDAIFGSPFHRADVRLVAEDAVVVVPVSSRERPGSARGSAGGATGAGSASSEDVVVALTPEEIVTFHRALAVEAIVACTPRSGRASSDGGEPATEAPGQEAGARRAPFGRRELDYHVVEVVTGDKLEVRVVPSPAGPAPEDGAEEAR